MNSISFDCEFDKVNMLIFICKDNNVDNLRSFIFVISKKFIYKDK